ncbi:MAG: helix-turn-helix domain-containing protein, partial [Actinomycetota bacterium]
MLALLSEQVEQSWAESLASAAAHWLHDMLLDRNTLLPLPSRGPARAVAAKLLEDPSLRWDLFDWAARVNVSERTLRRAFLEETGLPFRRWQIRLRVHRAVALIESGSPPDAVAREVGYGSEVAFVRVFRDEIGLTPNEYARRVDRPAGGGSWPIHSEIRPKVFEGADQHSLSRNVHHDEQGVDMNEGITDRRTFIATAAAVGAGWALAACGSDSDQSSEQSSADAGVDDGTTSAPASQADSSEPADDASATRTIQHVLGSSDVPVDPQRVFSTSRTVLDAVVAVGVQPVAVGFLPDESYPYLDELLGPETAFVGQPPNLEQLATVDPDLAVSLDFGLEEFYDELSQIAPTVAVRTGDSSS